MNQVKQELKKKITPKKINPLACSDLRHGGDCDPVFPFFSFTPDLALNFSRRGKKYQQTVLWREPAARPSTPRFTLARGFFACLTLCVLPFWGSTFVPRSNEYPRILPHYRLRPNAQRCGRAGQHTWVSVIPTASSSASELNSLEVDAKSVPTPELTLPSPR